MIILYRNFKLSIWSLCFKIQHVNVPFLYTEKSTLWSKERDYATGGVSLWDCLVQWKWYSYGCNQRVCWSGLWSHLKTHQEKICSQAHTLLIGFMASASWPECPLGSLSGRSLQLGSLFHQIRQPRRQEGESADKMEVSMFNNLIMEAESHPLCHILLAGQRRKSQGQLTLKQRKLQKVVNTRCWDHWKPS